MTASRKARCSHSTHFASNDGSLCTDCATYAWGGSIIPTLPSKCPYRVLALRACSAEESCFRPRALSEVGPQHVEVCQAGTFLAKYLLRGWGIYGLRASIQLHNAMAFLFLCVDFTNKNFVVPDGCELVAVVSRVELYIPQ